MGMMWGGMGWVEGFGVSVRGKGGREGGRGKGEGLKEGGEKGRIHGWENGKVCCAWLMRMYESFGWGGWNRMEWAGWSVVCVGKRERVV